jgi:hypothetical protein
MVARAPKRRALPKVFDRVRAICLALPEGEEKVSHGAPTFHVRNKTFVMFLDNHHDDGRVAIWCKAPPGAQAMLVDADAEHFLVPPYVGPSGWVGVRLDRPRTDWGAVAAIVEDAWRMAAPRRLLTADGKGMRRGHETLVRLDHRAISPRRPD